MLRFIPRKWDEQALPKEETLSHEEGSAAPHRGSPTQTASGYHDDRRRPWGCLEPLLHAQPRWRSGRPRPLPDDPEGDREVVHGRASGTGGHGSGYTFDLDQRTASRAWCHEV